MIYKAKEVISKGIRNKDFFKTLLDFTVSDNAEERELLLKKIILPLYQRVVSIEFDNTKSSTIGFAQHLLENKYIFEHLDRTPHFGCLSPLFDINASRLDYVRLICQALYD